MTSKYEMINGCALAELPALIERGARVSLVNADIPYFRVKGDEWDRQWKTEGEFLGWVDTLCGLLTQILLPNGSLYLYASPRMARKVGNVVAEHFNILQEITWNKAGADYGRGDPRATSFKAVDTSGLRKYLECSERVIFAEQNVRQPANPLGGIRKQAYSPLGSYISGARERAGLSKMLERLDEVLQ